MWFSRCLRPELKTIEKSAVDSGDSKEDSEDAETKIVRLQQEIATCCDHFRYIQEQTSHVTDEVDRWKTRINSPNPDAGLVRVWFEENTDRVYVYTLCGRVLQTTTDTMRNIGITQSLSFELSTTSLVLTLLEHGRCGTELSLSEKARVTAAGLCPHLLDSSLRYVKLNIGGVFFLLPCDLLMDKFEYFHARVSRWTTANETALFVDRSGDQFVSVLDHVEKPGYTGHLQNELVFYGYNHINHTNHGNQQKNSTFVPTAKDMLAAERKEKPTSVDVDILWGKIEAGLLYAYREVESGRQDTKVIWVYISPIPGAASRCHKEDLTRRLERLGYKVLHWTEKMSSVKLSCRS